MADNNEDVKISSSLQPVQEKTELPQQTQNPNSVDSGLAFEEIKRYVDASIAKLLDDIVKADKKPAEPEPPKEEDKGEW